MFQPQAYDDGRGRYPDRLAAAVPKGFRAYVQVAADLERIPVAELIRRAVERHASEILAASDRRAA